MATPADPQFTAWAQILEIAQRYGTIRERRDAITAAGISLNLDDPFSGYYRHRRGKDGPFDPVAIWREGDELVIFWGTEEARLEAVWPYCVWHPVSFDAYTRKMAGTEWADVHAIPTDADPAPAQPTNGAGAAAPAAQPAKTEAERAASAIERALAGVDEYAKIDSDEQRDKAQSLRSTLNDLSNRAKKRRDALCLPHKEAIEDIKAEWNPLIDKPKDGAGKIRAAQEAWATVKIQRRQAAEAEQQRLADEERARQAQAQQPAPQEPGWRETQEPPPAGDNVEQSSFALDAGAAAEPPPPPPPPPAPETTKSTSFRGGSGRAAREQEVEVVTGFSDQDAAYNRLRDYVEVKNALMLVAQRLLDDTGEVVPGVTTETRGKVRG